jgi:hypothetical protein
MIPVIDRDSTQMRTHEPVVGIDDRLGIGLGKLTGSNFNAQCRQQFDFAQLLTASDSPLLRMNASACPLSQYTPKQHICIMYQPCYKSNEHLQMSRV